MEIVTSEINRGEKLVENAENLLIEKVVNIKSTNKRITRQAEPHIRPHKVKGRLYYTYCRGMDKEAYLGTPEFILEAVLEKRLKIARS